MYVGDADDEVDVEVVVPELEPLELLEVLDVLEALEELEEVLVGDVALS